MIDHCISALKKRKEELLYRYYITDALKAQYNLNARFADILTEETQPKRKKRTKEEIISTIKSKLRKLEEK